MTATTTTPTTTAGSDPDVGSDLDLGPLHVRTRIAAAWTSMLFVFAYVDLFSLYRPDVRAELSNGALAGFAIGESFLLATTIYILVPSLMVVGTTALRAPVVRWANVVLAAGYAVTIVVGAIGEMGYYVVGSAVEVALLVAIVRWAWTWPRHD